MASLSNQSTIKQVIDMGCGSGVLAIAAAKLFSANVIAVDIDDEAVIVTQRNCQQNNIDDIVTFRSDGFDNVYFTDDLQVDLIVANILATPLIFMAASMKKYLKSNGMAVLSGLLTRQKADVVNAYSEQGFDLVREVVIDDWCALLIQKK
jgi:ribosomal protein L11 methyltransferase